jgi:hypothetical protein
VKKEEQRDVRLIFFNHMEPGKDRKDHVVILYFNIR